MSDRRISIAAAAVAALFGATGPVAAQTANSTPTAGGGAGSVSRTAPSGGAPAAGAPAAGAGTPQIGAETPAEKKADEQMKKDTRICEGC